MKKHIKHLALGSLSLAATANAAFVTVDVADIGVTVTQEYSNLYDTADSAPSDLGLNLYTSAGVDQSDTKVSTGTAQIRINNQFIYRASNPGVALINNSGTITVGSDPLFFGSTGAVAPISFMAQVGTSWYVSELVLLGDGDGSQQANGYGTWTNDNTPDIYQGWTTDDTVWTQLTTTAGGADITGGFTVPTLGSGAALPSGDILNTGIYAPPSEDDTFAKTYFVGTIPEPSSLVLGALGGLMMLRRRR